MIIGLEGNSFKIPSFNVRAPYGLDRVSSDYCTDHEWWTATICFCFYLSICLFNQL